MPVRPAASLSLRDRGGRPGASIRDSRNRGITIHGTDCLLVRDCVGDRRVGLDLPGW